MLLSPQVMHPGARSREGARLDVERATFVLTHGDLYVQMRLHNAAYLLLVVSSRDKVVLNSC